ncbi:hypothetical protein [Micromonospora humi]|uniref:Uncharacterized protein n=1 Tax=Micromonospora humi TaxID=745366 RepID=A0A1C5JA16_9ACTN|nr:hypothetical protein [Micromonospora humi]SCG67415.1 hypothetical protein GA0070213_109268 [Micromonospora humi]
MKAHRTDIVSFAFGLVFLGLALWWLLARILGLAVPPVGWFLAGGLVVIGLLGLVGALRSVRGPNQPAQPDGPGEPGQPDQPEATVAAPWRDGSPAETATPVGPDEPRRDGSPTGAATPVGADEWPTDAMGDVSVQAREDGPVDGQPRWSPAEERPVLEPEDRSDPVTRELPPVDAETDEPPTGRRTSGEPPV